MKLNDKFIFEVQRYVFDETTFSEFEDWYRPWSWRPPKDMKNIVTDIDHKLSEFLNGHITENELKQHIKQTLE